MRKFKRGYNKLKFLPWIILLPIQFVIFYYLPRFSWFNSAYQSFFEFKQKVQSFVFGVFSFSVGDLIYAILVLFLLYFSFNFLKKLYVKDFRKIRTYILRFLIVLNIVYFNYNICWGLAYNISHYTEYYAEDCSEKELKALAHKYLEKAKKSRSNFSSNMEIELNSNEKELAVQFFPKTEYGSLKKSLFSKVLCYTSISGYFNPFTGEAQYNYLRPKAHLPNTIGHELAHQHGYSKEYDASFKSFLTGIESKNPELNYSANYYALRHILRKLNNTDTIFVNNIIDSYSEGMEQDRQAAIDFYEKYDLYNFGILSSLNDQFLKANGEDGNQSYSYFVELLVGYERTKP